MEIEILYWGNLKIEGQPLTPSTKNNFNEWSIRISKGNENKYFQYWTGLGIPNLDLKDAFSCICRDAENSYLSFEEYCEEFGESSDSIITKDLYDGCHYSREKLLDLDPDINFSTASMLSDYGKVVEKRIYAEICEIAADDHCIILFDDKPVEAECTYENRAHPGSDQYHSLGEGWVDCENRMPFENSDIEWWTPLFSIQTISIPEVQLIKPLTSEDDEYYATLI